MGNAFHLEIANAWQHAKLSAVKSITKCFYPGCKNPSINTHILQKNGIISDIAENGHVMQMEFNPYLDKAYYFKKTGIKTAFSFNCFCNRHDSEIFSAIETKEIDFSKYRNLLLFTFRAKYNEKYRKLVSIRMNEFLIENNSNLFESSILEEKIKQEKLSIIDSEKMEKLIWDDLINENESFIFLVRNIKKIPICLASFYTYETPMTSKF